MAKFFNQWERGKEELKNVYEIMSLIDGKVSIEDFSFTNNERAVS